MERLLLKMAVWNWTFAEFTDVYAMDDDCEFMRDDYAKK